MEPGAGQVDGVEPCAAEVSALELGATEICTNEVSHGMTVTVTCRALPLTGPAAAGTDGPPPIALPHRAVAIPPQPRSPGRCRTGDPPVDRVHAILGGALSADR